MNAQLNKTRDPIDWPSWCAWSLDGLERGCDPKTLGSALLARGFHGDKVAAFIDGLNACWSEQQRWFTPRWRAWAINSLGSGSTPADIEQEMQRKKFMPVFARAKVEQLRQEMERIAKEGIDVPRLPATFELDGRRIRVAMTLTQPRIALFDNVLSKEECEALMQAGEKRLRRSTVVDIKTGDSVVVPNRTSEGTFFALAETPLIRSLDDRLSKLGNFPVERGEGIQLLRYERGGEYKPHFDYFPPENPGSAKRLEKRGQRVATLIAYLNDVPLGGETLFSKLHLQIKPQQGSVLYFEYCRGAGKAVDELTHHGGAPVLDGEKWIATKWMRERA